MFIEIKVKRRIKCTVCKEVISKDEASLRCGQRKEHIGENGNKETVISSQGPSICVHCLKLAVKTAKESKEWTLRGWNFLTKKTYRKFIPCNICGEEIHEGDHMWVSKYSPEFNSSLTVTDFTCMHCIEKIVESVSEKDFEESLLKRFEYKLDKC